MLIEKLTLTNLLSFGPTPQTIAFQPLSILIGANGSGKSNILEAIDLLRSAHDQVAIPPDDRPDMSAWLWKSSQAARIATIDAELHDPFGKNLICRMSQAEVAQSFLFSDSQLNNDDLYSPDHPRVSWALSQMPRIRLYREFCFDNSVTSKFPQWTKGSNEHIDTDASNLGSVLHRLSSNLQVKRELLKALQVIYDGIEDFEAQVEGDEVQIFISEGDSLMAATRLSSGTLRYLCLLAILCDPDPPPLICLDMPEHGLHTDVLSSLAGLLRKAAERTQIIVTTHSEILVDCMTDAPESVYVCEKYDGQTTVTQLSRVELAPWLKRYRLGQLWSRGDIGGNRW